MMNILMRIRQSIVKLYQDALTWFDYNNIKYYGEFKFLYGDYVKSKNHKDKLRPFSNTDLYIQVYIFLTIINWT